MVYYGEKKKDSNHLSLTNTLDNSVTHCRYTYVLNKKYIFSPHPYLFPLPERRYDRWYVERKFMFRYQKQKCNADGPPKVKYYSTEIDALIGVRPFTFICCIPDQPMNNLNLVARTAVAYVYEKEFPSIHHDDGWAHPANHLAPLEKRPSLPPNDSPPPCPQHDHWLLDMFTDAREARSRGLAFDRGYHQDDFIRARLEGTDPSLAWSIGPNTPFDDGTGGGEDEEGAEGEEGGPTAEEGAGPSRVILCTARRVSRAILCLPDPFDPHGGFEETSYDPRINPLAFLLAHPLPLPAPPQCCWACRRTTRWTRTGRPPRSAPSRRRRASARRGSGRSRSSRAR